MDDWSSANVLKSCLIVFIFFWCQSGDKASKKKKKKNKKKNTTGDKQVYSPSWQITYTYVPQCEGAVVHNAILTTCFSSILLYIEAMGVLPWCRLTHSHRLLCLMCGCQEVAGDDIDALLETIEQSNGLTLQSEGCGGSDNRPVLYVEHRWVGAQHNIRTLRGVTSSNQNTHHLWQSFISDRFDWDLPSFVCQEPESWDGVEEILWSSSSSWRSKVRSIQNSLSVGVLLLKVTV